jgi:1,4-dihydroxy-2-naphthoate octaprenyltransferase
LKSPSNKNVNLIHWIQAARLKFLPQGIMPVILAGAIAYSEGIFKPIYFIVALPAAAAIQIGLTMLNDTLDFVYGADQKKTGAKNPFSGGSGVLTTGIIKPKQAFQAIFLLYLFVILCGLYLVREVGIELLWIGLLGVAISIFYSAKPFRFAYHGMGEVMMFLGYGPVFTLGG